MSQYLSRYFALVLSSFLLVDPSACPPPLSFRLYFYLVILVAVVIAVAGLLSLLLF